MPSVIVWDLETVPDTNGYATAKGLHGLTPEQLRDDMGEKFPKHIYHSILCIGAVVAHNTTEGWIVDAVGAPHVGDRTEKDLISAFVRKIAELRPQLVTFNGNSFDLPVLRYRAIIHGLSAPGLSCRPYFKRYGNNSVDLCDELSSFTSGGKVKLDELSKILGFAGKPNDIDGSEVENHFRAGKIAEIAAYCETDVVNTFKVWLRHELFCGRLTSGSYEQSERSLTEFIRAHASSKHHLRTFGNSPILENGSESDGVEAAPCV